MSGRTAKVKVRLVVEVHPSATWGDDCAVSQIRSQGVQAAIAMLRTALGEVGTIVSIHEVDMVVPLETKP